MFLNRRFDGSRTEEKVYEEASMLRELMGTPTPLIHIPQQLLT